MSLFPSFSLIFFILPSSSLPFPTCFFFIDGVKYYQLFHFVDSLKTSFLLCIDLTLFFSALPLLLFLIFNFFLVLLICSFCYQPLSLLVFLSLPPAFLLILVVILLPHLYSVKFPVNFPGLLLHTLIFFLSV